MSSITVCDSGIIDAPAMPWISRKTTISGRFCATPPEHGSDGEAGDRGQEHRLAADLQGEPARQRRHNRGGDDVAGQHPGDLVLAGAEFALHVRQGHVGDGRIQRVHQRGQHQGPGDGKAIVDVGLRRHAATCSSPSRTLSGAGGWSHQSKFHETALSPSPQWGRVGMGWKLAGEDDAQQANGAISRSSPGAQHPPHPLPPPHRGAGMSPIKCGPARASARTALPAPSPRRR